MSKKINKTVGVGLVGLSLLSLAPGVVDAATNVWHANSPNEIGTLNQDGTYTVKKGDTIWAIGVHFNIKPNVIEEVNHVNRPNLLQIGTILRLHIDKNNNQAQIEAITPDGSKYTKKLNNNDKIIKHKKFGTNVEQNINNKAVSNNTVNNSPKETSPAQDNSQPSQRVNNANNNNTNNSNISNEQLAMAAYYKLYKDYANNNAFYNQHFYVNQDANNKYTVGQGFSDSTFTFTINGNTINYVGGGNGTTPSEKGTFNRQDVINNYYSTHEQKAHVNNAIQNAQSF